MPVDHDVEELVQRVFSKDLAKNITSGDLTPKSRTGFVILKCPSLVQLFREQLLEAQERGKAAGREEEQMKILKMFDKHVDEWDFLDKVSEYCKSVSPQAERSEQ